MLEALGHGGLVGVERLVQAADAKQRRRQQHQQRHGKGQGEFEAELNGKSFGYTGRCDNSEWLPPASGALPAGARRSGGAVGINVFICT